MSLPEEEKFLTRIPDMQSTRDQPGKVSMDQDDFEAHLAWVRVKRSFASR